MNDSKVFQRTTFAATIVERPLKDGRPEVKVVLHTQNALVWVIEGRDFANGPILFGYRPTEVADGETPVLGNCTFELVFIITAPGAPMPDLMQLAFFPGEGQELLFLAMRAQAAGALREDFGVPEGTPAGYHRPNRPIHDAFYGRRGRSLPGGKSRLKSCG